ncbi:MAG TPA: hypothetical protein VKD67_00705 [Acidimicrobiales bacterium]|nr:hypothetical protein [Acidimicrobiales bacterium]
MRRLFGVLGLVVALAACGRSSPNGSGSEVSTTAAPTTTAPVTTTTGAPVVSPTPVAPIASNPTAPMPGLCTQSGAGSVCPPAPEAAQQFVGLSEADAAARAAQHGWAFRVAERDGEQLLLTQDYDPERVNVAVSSGTVQRAWFG